MERIAKANKLLTPRNRVAMVAEEYSKYDLRPRKLWLGSSKSSLEDVEDGSDRGRAFKGNCHAALFQVIRSTPMQTRHSPYPGTSRSIPPRRISARGPVNKMNLQDKHTRIPCGPKTSPLYTLITICGGYRSRQRPQSGNGARNGSNLGSLP